MYDKRSEELAKRFGILDRMQALEDDLMKIDGIVNIEFDIRDCCEIRHVILIPQYDIDVRREDYFDARRKQLNEIVAVCKAHGLLNSGDRIEDYGAHWYIVRTCDDEWDAAFEKCTTEGEVSYT